MDFTEEEKRCIFNENSDPKNPTKLHNTSTLPEHTADTTPPTTSPQPEEFHIDTSTRPQIQTQQLATSTDAYISSPTGIEEVNVDDDQFGHLEYKDEIIEELLAAQRLLMEENFDDYLSDGDSDIPEETKEERIKRRMTVQIKESRQTDIDRANNQMVRHGTMLA